MKIKVLGASGGRAKGHFPPAFLVEEKILLDAGTITEALTLEKTFSIEHVFLTHAHLDHVEGLAFLADLILILGKRKESIIIHGIEHTISVLKDFLFNNQLWPDFSKLPTEENPVITYNIIQPESVLKISGFEIVAIPTNHTISSVGYLVSYGNSSLVYTGDTFLTENFWDKVFMHKIPDAIIIECTFPNAFSALAEKSKHLTPNLLGKELKSVPMNIPICVFHIKPGYYEQIKKELKQLKHKINIASENTIIQC